MADVAVRGGNLCAANVIDVFEHGLVPLNVGLTRHLAERLADRISVILLILMLVGALPSWPHSRRRGYYPSGGLGLILVMLVVLLLLGRI